MATRGPLADNRDLIAGIGGGGFAPLATFVFDLPLYATLPGAILVFIGLRLILAPKTFFEDLPTGKFAKARVDLARDVLVKADRALSELAQTAEVIRQEHVQEQLLHLHRIATDISIEVEKDPGRLNQVQRLLTYYLPAASRVATGYAALERKFSPNEERVIEAQVMIERLDQVFSEYADRLVMPEVENLDIDLQLLDDAIRDEGLERVRS
ncbi:MAG: 5-bromo-4-chloroindolyl phosphate hydrolysis family protein [Alphaproteobacteria bacterium]|nr:5-bromo-4-chloroindolyl phosphate hydrolysis family protein [Alphaproteobacteria bacterium SS10]